MSSITQKKPEEVTLVAPPPRRPALAERWEITTLDFKVPDAGGGAAYDPRDPSRISIRLDGPANMLRLTVDEAIAARLRDDLTRALTQFHARRTGRTSP